MDFLEYSDVTCEVRGAMNAGRLKLTDDKIMFTHTKSGKKDTLKAEEIDLVNWQRLAGVWGIRMFTKNGNLHRFAGFKEPEREKLAKHFSTNFSLEMLDRELSVKGWNWGNAEFNGSVLQFEVGKHDAFEVPLSYVSQCNAGKNEVTLEFSLNDDAPVNLAEMRFHIPASGAGEDMEDTEDDPAEAFKRQIIKKANIVTTTGDAVAIFREIHCLSPRGRYDIKMFPTFIHLHGKTFDYKIPNNTVMRLFLLPHKDQRQMYFCVNVDPPIKQGQTRYHYLVFSFRQEEEEDIELGFTEEEIKEKFEGKLEKNMKGPTFEVVSKLMKAMVNKKITVPGAFMGHSGTPAISCSFKAASGFLYPLERGFIFVYKPPIYIRFDEISHVNFARSGGNTRSFDIEVHSRSDMVYIFSSIEKDEYGRLFEFVKGKKITVKSTGKMDGSKLGASMKDDNIDHRLEMVKADAESESEESMSSDDTDFNPDNLDAKDAKEEYDSDPSDTDSEMSDDGEDGSEDEEKKKLKAEKKAAKKEKSAARAERKKTSKPTERSGRKKTKVKLPGMPKKPMSGFFLFMQEEGRERAKKENPEASIGDIGKMVGKMWAEMEDKSKYEEKTRIAKEKYEEEYKAWFEDGGEEALKKAKADQKAGKSAEKSAKSPKKKSSKSSAPSTAGGGAGGSFKSKEFIEDSSSGGEEEEKKKKSSDAEMKSGSEKGSGSGSD